ncbi:hypothetical protein scyTo_0022480, partial [Scyliorhinus torazame]|nr:hypothetical protein [Scyliorhinus torazame]
GTSEHSQIQAPGEDDRTTGTGTSEHSQIQAPAPGEGHQTTGTGSGKENPSGDMLLVNAASYDGKTDIQRKHKETLWAQTETLRVNPILIKEKVKTFQLVARYTELTVISTVRDRTLVEHELLARGRDHEEWREKHLRRELEKIRPDQLFQSSFSERNSKSGSSAAAAQPLEEFLGPFSHQIAYGVIDWVKEKVESQIGKTESETAKRNLLNTFHYLFESQNKEVAQATVGSVDILILCGLTLKPVDCTVLSHVIGLCNIIKELNLESCSIHCDGFQQLRSTIHKCQVLRLKNNKLGDSGVKELLFAALRKPDCKIQKLDLWAADLTDSCAEDLASALNTNWSLTSLNLGSNAFTDQSIPDIRRLILNCRCLDVIWLVENQFSLNGTNQLMSLQGTRSGLSVKLSISIY